MALDGSDDRSPRRNDFPEVLETSRTFTLKGVVIAFMVGIAAHCVSDEALHRIRNQGTQVVCAPAPTVNATPSMEAKAEADMTKVDLPLP
jgi:hypothetical protein